MWENWLERRNNYRTAVYVACAAVEGTAKEGRRRVRLVNRSEGWVPILRARTPASGKTSNIHRQPFCASFFFQTIRGYRRKEGVAEWSEHTCTYACRGRKVELPFFLPTRPWLCTYVCKTAALCAPLFFLHDRALEGRGGLSSRFDSLGSFLCVRLDPVGKSCAFH